MMKHRFLPLAATAALFLAGPAQAGLFDDAEARQQIETLKQDFNGRVETITNGQLDLAAQNEQLRAEVARLRGQVEVLLNEIESLKTRQHDFYVDLNNRLTQFETNSRAAAANAGAATTVSTGSYETALSLLKQGKASEALAEFNTFIAA
ncbi:MAG: tol-pal system protein YbgF, partial [Azoarcus sp.]|nr:tol-pal system protein YbgF [Azoarcus sp.]